MKIETQRLRNLTTGVLHTKMEDIYIDIENITGMEGVMTHMLPRAVEALKPHFKNHIKDESFFNDKHDPSLVGEVEIPVLTKEEKVNFFKRL